ncbi:MAG: M67 family metallopeptidase [Alphaproteobacteria bacterium]|nr:M67 family metallopeptidase [Alphaproteobacteria bacterium]
MTLETVRIPPLHLTLMRIAAQTAAPEEACGLILGHTEEAIAVVCAIAPSLNRAEGDRARSFAIDPDLQFRLQRDLRGGRESVIGVYHSHPNGKAEPSPRDAAMAFEAGFIWVVVGVDGAGETVASAHVATGDTGGEAFRRIKLLSN